MSAAIQFPGMHVSAAHLKPIQWDSPHKGSLPEGLRLAAERLVWRIATQEGMIPGPFSRSGQAHATFYFVHSN
jgi:hypothetical protein